MIASVGILAFVGTVARLTNRSGESRPQELTVANSQSTPSRENENVASKSDVGQTVNARWKSGTTEPWLRNLANTCDYLTSAPKTIHLTAKYEIRLGRQTPVFASMEPQSTRLVGYCEPTYLSAENSASKSLTVRWLDSSLRPIGSDFIIRQSPDSIADLVELMLPPERREKLISLLTTRVESHRDELKSAAEPLLIRVAGRIAKVIESRITDSLENHQEEMKQLLDRYESEIVQVEMVPLLRDEVFPIAKSEFQPLAREIGQQLFERASVWSFGWRYLYDQSPLPSRNLVGREFERFVLQDATPVLESEMPKILEAMQRSVERTLQNPGVRQAVSEMVDRIGNDPEFRKIVQQTAEEVFADGTPFQSILESELATEEGSVLVERFRTIVEPWLLECGVEIFGSPQDGLQQEFLAALRSRVLHKDTVWIEVPARSGELTREDTVGNVFSVRFDTSRGVFPGFDL